MAESGNVLVGSDTQSIERHSTVTGVQRVVREAHLALTDALSGQGIRIVPLHTRQAPRSRSFRGNPYLAADPVLDQRPVLPEDVDVFLFLDLHAHADFSRVHREKRRRPRPVITLIHDVLPLLHPEWWFSDPERVFRIYVQQVLAVSDHVVVTSAKVRGDLLSLGWRIPGEIHVIPLGSSFRPRVPEAAPDGRLSMLYVSTVEPRKGHDVLLAAFDILRGDGHDVDLSIVGHEGWHCDDVVRAIRSHPDFEGRLRWLRGVDDLTVATIARGCSVGVFPTQDEGFGLFLEEGLAHGLKMVVSDIPVMRERAQANVHFADRTPAALADAIARAHSEPWDATGSVRTMQDFGDDLARLVSNVLHVSAGSSTASDDDR